MTDKQIIIDDQKETIHRLQKECTEKTDSILSLGDKLKRKEEECKELKERLYVQAKEKVKYIFELNQLKAENEELKKIIERLDVPKHEVIDMDIALENEKLKQTLTEIKEYFIKECEICKEQYAVDGDICGECQVYEFLQKISEVLDE